MSEAIIGTIIAVAGTLLGSGLGVWLSFKSTKAQIEAQSAQQERQLQHERLLSRTKTLIEIRKEYLLPLKETIGQWTEQARKTANLFAIDSKNRAPGVSNAELSKQTAEALRRGRKITSKLYELRGQLSDSVLGKLVDELFDQQKEVDKKRIYAIGLINDKSRAAEMLGRDSAIGPRRDEQAAMDLILNLCYKVNRRIEDLLSGDLPQ